MKSNTICVLLGFNCIFKAIDINIGLNIFLFLFIFIPISL